MIGSLEVTQEGSKPRRYIVTSLTGTIYRHNRRLLKAIDYPSIPNTTPIPGWSTSKNHSALEPTTDHPHKGISKKKVQLNLTTKETPK